MEGVGTMILWEFALTFVSLVLVLAYAFFRKMGEPATGTKVLSWLLIVSAVAIYIPGFRRLGDLLLIVSFTLTAVMLLLRPLWRKKGRHD